MKARCLNPKHPKYPRYGGRGITIADSWLSITEFSQWALANGWQEGLQIDRTDNDGPYNPDNCQWVTASANAKKKSTTRLTDAQAAEIRKRLAEGETRVALARAFNVNHGTIWMIDNGRTHANDIQQQESHHGTHSRTQTTHRSRKSLCGGDV